VGKYLARSYDFIIDLLQRMDRSEPFQLDPSGDVALRMAKQIRRKTLRSIGPIKLHEEAIRHFGMPATALAYASRLHEPLYVPTRVSNN
jgi:hypothetical protein